MTPKMLLNIFGEDADKLTEKEISVANKVAEWFDPSISIASATLKNESNLLKACRYALEQMGESWESVMLAKSRKRKLVDTRYVIIHFLWNRIGGTQSHKASLLGGKLDRTTFLHAVKAATDLLECNADYRGLYMRISNSINKYLENTL